MTGHEARSFSRAGPADVDSAPAKAEAGAQPAPYRKTGLPLSWEEARFCVAVRGMNTRKMVSTAPSSERFWTRAVWSDRPKSPRIRYPPVEHRLTAFNLKIGENAIPDKGVVQSVCAVVDLGSEHIHAFPRFLVALVMKCCCSR